MGIIQNDTWNQVFNGFKWNGVIVLKKKKGGEKTLPLQKLDRIHYIPHSQTYFKS